MLQWVLSFLSGPLLGKLVDAYQRKLDAGNTSERIAAELAGRALEVEKREAELAVQYKIATIGAWYSPDHLLGYIAVVYIAKIIVWDKVLALGSTDPITGEAGVWFGWIVAFWLGKRGAENIARIFKR